MTAVLAVAAIGGVIGIAVLAAVGWLYEVRSRQAAAQRRAAAAVARRSTVATRRPQDELRHYERRGK